MRAVNRPRPVAALVLALLLSLLGACSSTAHRVGSAASTAPPASAAATTTTGAPATTPLTPRGPAYTYTLHVGGRARGYRLHVPPAATAGNPLPLVLNLHGATQNATLEELQSGMDASADHDGYLVAYPNGTRISKVLTPDPVAKDAQYGFDAGACCGDPSAHHVDDVGFLLAVIADAAQRTPVDLRRVYVTGISNGGMMAYAMAAEASTHIAAIASVAGQVELRHIDPTRAVPTLEFHSVDDPIAKWAGVPSTDPTRRYSVMDGVNQWVRADGCDAAPHTNRPIVGAGASEGLTATFVRFSGCHSGSAVALWRFTGSGHVWPGAPFNTGPRNTWILDGVGRGTTLVDANETMWSFFEQFALPTAP
jgi:polyhydroxybutyrate depolymerase